MMNTPVIKVYDEIHQLNIVVNFIVFKNIRNRKSDQSFNDFQQQMFSELIPELSKEMLKNDPVLEGYRVLRAKLGLSRNKYTCSSEALLKHLLKKNTLPQINLLVDIYNLFSVKTHIFIGAHELGIINHPLDFKLTNGDELFIPMGSDEPIEISKGEYAYIDGGNEVLCRLDHRQCHKTRISESTRSCLLIVQGNPNTTREQINSATEELIKLVNKYCGGDAEVVRY
ncbi:MAG: phenylalanine--tRNA ligase beta subunit-related protein [Proteobacteria bacterium]|nr:phenylalanine--tRNA ligase beta subunit-related protein [Pseudomonadota bacterium]